MRVTLLRNATLLVKIAGRRLLVDPALDDVGARPPIANTANPKRNPLVALPFSAEEVVRDLDAVLITHLHQDHFDAMGERLIPRNLPVFSQPADEQELSAFGLRPQPVDDQVVWNGIRIARTGGRHSLDQRVERALGPVSGFVLNDLYLSSDSVWCEEVATAIERWRPSAAVVNAGAASFIGSGPISMTIADVAEVASRVPRVIAIHLEAINHCPLTRPELRAALPEVLVPGRRRDDRTVTLGPWRPNTRVVRIRLVRRLPRRYTSPVGFEALVAGLTRPRARRSAAGVG